MMVAQKCIWMDAESVEYQLCPLNHNCDLCDFHKEMKRGCRRPGISAEATTIDIRNPQASLIQFTPGVQFINGHFWIKRTGKGKVILGIDAFLWQLFSSVQKIITPKVNSSIIENQCLAWLQLEDDIVYLRSPLPGQILQVNPCFNSDRIQDTHLYLSPQEDLWLVELELKEGFVQLEYLSKEAYFNQTEKDIARFKKLLDFEARNTHPQVNRCSQLDKSTFSKYLLNVSDSLAYAC